MTTRSNKPKLTGEARETASRMWKSGASASEIGAALGVSRNTVVGVAYRDRVNFPSKGKGRGYTRQSMSGPIVEWSDDRVDQAAGMWADGMTIAQIGAAMGVSAFSIRGIARRRRDRFPERARGRAEGERRETKSAKAAPGARKEPRVPTIEPSTFDLGRMRHAKTLLEIGPCECRWPLTDSGPHLFCADVALAGKSWCAHHYGRLVGAGTRSEQNAVWQAKRAAA